MRKLRVAEFVENLKQFCREVKGKRVGDLRKSEENLKILKNIQEKCRVHAHSS